MATKLARYLVALVTICATLCPLDAGPIQRGHLAVLQRKRAAGGSFYPPDAGTILVWYDASALGLADNDPISSWTDTSGNANHLEQTLTARPTFKTGIQNGLAVARFDGSNDSMTTSVANLSPTDVTIFIVMAPTGTISNASDAGLLSRGTAVYPQGFIYLGDYSGKFSGETMTFGCDTAGTGNILGAAVTANFSGWNTWAFRLNGTTEAIFKNGSSQSLNVSSDGHMDSSGNNRWKDVNTIGLYQTGSPLAGDIGEIIIYSEALDDTEVGQVSTWLKTKWGTP